MEGSESQEGCRIGTRIAPREAPPNPKRSMPNRLAEETSPYLLQHKDNPVDWYPWGTEALERARREDRPILLSIGYSACHWCHVMEHESFEDAETARIMNERFVNVKVDREEHPDVDSVYMAAVQQITGRGGWPLTAFLLPSGEPFWGGTYFPPEPRHGMPSFRQVLAGIHEAYTERRGQVDRSAAEMGSLLRRLTEARSEGPAPDREALERATVEVVSRLDRRHGGFGGAPKFPQAMILELLLRVGHKGSQEALDAATLTLRRMAAGGIYDHVGGGFHRYSVDAEWLVPHFEKMLYDNALLARVYLHAYQATGEVRFRKVVEETLTYLSREMRAPDGGFAASEDADSEGGEGFFYIWNGEEIDEVLGPEDGARVRHAYGVTKEGNFEGRNILNRPIDRAVEDREDLRSQLERLREARERRPRPARDDKVILAWNGMALRAFAEAGRVLDRPDLLLTASDAAEFLLSSLRPDGSLRRIYKDGRARFSAHLEDYAQLALGLLALHEADGEPRWLQDAAVLAEAMLGRFWDEDRGIFFDAPPEDSGTVVRARDPYDNATPSGSSGAAEALLWLARLLDRDAYGTVAERTLASAGDWVTRAPAAFGTLLVTLDRLRSVPRELLIADAGDRTGGDVLWRVAAPRYLPDTLLVRIPAVSMGDLPDAPLFRGRGGVDGRAAAYLCEGYVCQRPVTEPAELRALLD